MNSRSWFRSTFVTIVLLVGACGPSEDTAPAPREGYWVVDSTFTGWAVDSLRGDFLGPDSFPGAYTVVDSFPGGYWVLDSEGGEHWAVDGFRVELLVGAPSGLPPFPEVGHVLLTSAGEEILRLRRNGILLESTTPIWRTEPVHDTAFYEFLADEEGDPVCTLTILFRDDGRRCYECDPRTGDVGPAACGQTITHAP